MSLWEELRATWIAQGLTPGPGVSSEVISGFEEQHGVRLPEAMKAYFMAANGTGGGMDRESFTFWPLEEVELVEDALTYHSDRCDYPHCYLFCDWAIWCWGYAVRLGPRDSDAGPVYLVRGGSPAGGVVAESFEEFMKRYRDDAEGLSREKA